MTSNSAFRPIWTSAPGDTITDILGERKLSISEFAQRIGHTTEQARDLLQGRATITIGIARRLEQVLGASVEFWMSRDFQYRQDSARLHVAEGKWLAELPLGDMIKYGWIKPVPHPSEEVAACLRFFDVPSVRAWHQTYEKLRRLVAFRTSSSLDSRPAAVAAWLRRGTIECEEIRCDPWNPQRFEETLLGIRSLTREKSPHRFIPELRERCAACGVAVAFVRSPNGCRASGATRFISKSKVSLLLSFRHLSDDQFWFTFFHESGHALLHGEKGFFLEGVDTPNSKEEQEANEFAANTLVPTRFQSAMLDLPLDGRKVIRFARRLGVAPGVVVGQLQHFGRIKHNQLNALKRRYTWED
jgi:plasmid maintenance system antidote protein VapI/Zn-dependent peptidase ImmA (M78 family)